MVNKVQRISFLLLLVFSSIIGFSSDHAVEKSGEKTKEEIKKEIKETIKHHLQDSYIFEITHGVSFPLPVILFDGGIHVFSGGKFNHGHDVVESKGNFYKLDHGKIYKTDAAGTINYDAEHHATNARPFDFSITKNVFILLVMSAFLFFLFTRMAKKYKSTLNPGGSAKFLEPIVVFIRDEIAIPNIGEKHYKKYLNYLLTIFFFIWFLNLAGMTPLGISVTNNIAITSALAICTFVITTFTGNKNYWAHIFWMPGVPIPMRILLAPIELLGIFIKPFALMIRLYANMTAGHVVMMSIIGLIFVFKNYFATGAFIGLSIFLSVLELLVAALQAYIFTMLSSLYFGAAKQDHH
ncbi:F0F1 ATP synthase subunit A [Flavobacteriales bacterium]|nr:F0F1 ATP synthase subunit A [Flavobacteriales bacterium]